MPQPMMPQATMNPYAQNAAYSQPTVQPKVEKKKATPKDFASMMQQFEKASLEKKEEQEAEEREKEAAHEFDDPYGGKYDDAYGDEAD